MRDDSQWTTGDYEVPSSWPADRHVPYCPPHPIVPTVSGRIPPMPTDDLEESE